MVEDVGQGSIVEIESPERDRAFVFRWLSEIRNASNEEKRYRARGLEAQRLYRGETEKADNLRFNILFSNTQTLQSAVFNQSPKPDVRRRYRDENKAGKVASEVLERALGFSIDQYDFYGTVMSGVMDMLLTGRGVVRVAYEAFTETVEELVPDFEGNLVKEEREELVLEQAKGRYVYWEDYRQEPARTWDDVGWIAYRHLMKKREIQDRFGAQHSEVPLSYSVQVGGKDESKEPLDIFKRAVVWEIWDKEGEEVIFLAEGYDKILSRGEPPVSFTGFFDIPKPLVAMHSAGTNAPVAPYELYKELAKELNTISTRIFRLTKALKVVGIYDQTNEALASLLEREDSAMVPATNFNELLDNGGIRQAVQFLPIEEIARVLGNLHMQREQVKQTIFEVTGISDIMRGQSKASETATAQRIKGNFGTLRVQEVQKNVQRYIRDLMRLKAEVIAENFEQDTLEEMTGQDLSPIVETDAYGQPVSMQEPLAMLRNDVLRNYNIDIETDSTMVTDENDDQESAVRLMQAVSQYMTSMAPLVNSGLVPIEAAKELMMITVRRFKGVRAFEDALDNAVEQAQDQPEMLATQDGI